MSLEHLDEFEAEVAACREAADTMLVSVRMRSLRAALAEIRRLRAQLSEAQARLAEIEARERGV